MDDETVIYKRKKIKLTENHKIFINIHNLTKCLFTSLGSTEPPIKWVPGALFREMKR
jgi:hypothetical protein